MAGCRDSYRVWSGSLRPGDSRSEAPAGTLSGLGTPSLRTPGPPVNGYFVTRHLPPGSGLAGRAG